MGPSGQNQTAMTVGQTMEEEMPNGGGGQSILAFPSVPAEIQFIPSPLLVSHHNIPRAVPDPLAATPPLLVGGALVDEEEPSSTTGGDLSESQWARLSELKVQQLKEECKKRQLAVSGSKQQLLDRLRPFERQIVQQPDGGKNCCQQFFSSPPGAVVVGSHSSAVIDAVIDSVIDGSGLMEGHHRATKKGAAINKKCSSNNRIAGRISMAAEWPAGGTFKAKQRAKANKLERKGQQKGTLADLLRGGTAQQVMAALGPKLFDKGTTATAGCPCAAGKQQSAGKWKASAAVASDEQQPHHNSPLPNVGGQQQSVSSGSQLQSFESMTFSFAQMGSGGQFTPLEPTADIHIADENSVVTTTKGEAATTAAKTGGSPLEPIHHPHQLGGIGRATKGGGGQCHQCKSATPPSLSAGRDEPPALLTAGTTTKRRHSTHHHQNQHQNQCQQMGTGMAEWAVGGEPGGGGGSELMSAATLARHEETLRQQQRHILELQRELGRSQLGLQQHQHMLAEARRAALPRCPESGGRLLGAAGQVDFWLGQLEAARQLDRVHREQLQLMDRQVAGHRALVCAEQRLQEELHTEQAVQDICRLIRQEPKAALLIVQLLRRYQLERSVATTAVVVPPPPPAPSMVSQQQQPMANSQPPPPLLWNGLLLQQQQQPSAMLPGEEPPRKGGGCHHHRKRARESMTTTTASAANRRGPMERSNSVLGGLMMTSSAGAAVPTAGCACAGHPVTVIRRPNSSLGTETAHGLRCLGPVDMEEIFRSVLDESEQAKQHNKISPPMSLASVPELAALAHQPDIGQSPFGGQQMGMDCADAAAMDDLFPPLHSQVQDLQDLMEVLRDDQEKGQQLMMTRHCPSNGAADFQTDQLATFLAEEVELCRNASRTAFSSAVFPAQGQAMAVGSIRLGGGHQSADTDESTATLMAHQPGDFGGSSAANLLLFPCEEADDRVVDWLDSSFDQFTAVF